MVINLFSNRWYFDENVYIKGYCFDETSNFCEKNKLWMLFSSIEDEVSLLKTLTSLNGIFSVIINKPSFQAVVVDKARTTPLFFRRLDNQFIVTDNSYSLLREDDTIDTYAEFEYQNFNVTLGDRTLVEQIKQIKPLHYALFNDANCIQKPYYNYSVKAEDIVAVNYEKKFTETLHRTFKRLVQSVGKKQLVVPLTGGYDSRLILCMLKELKCENVVCYTVGREYCAEVTNAREVARRLGYRHYFINNCNADLMMKFKSETQFEDYYKFMGNLSSFVFVFEYLALQELTERNLIEKDAVFVPGHSGDFLAGSHFTKSGVKDDFSKRKLTKAVMSFLFPNEYRVKSSYKGKLKKQIGEKINNSYQNYCLPHSILDEFSMRIRLQPFINNAARIYEFFSYELRLPFWDGEMLNLFKHMPYKLKTFNVFYNNYLENNLFKKYDVNISDRRLQVSNKEIKLQIIKNKIKQVLPQRIIDMFSNYKDTICAEQINKPFKEELLKQKDLNLPVKVKGLTNNAILTYWYLLQVRKTIN